MPEAPNKPANVSVVSQPPLPTGSNNIGSVGVTRLPSLPAGTNFIGNVGIGAIGPGNNKIGSVTQSGEWNVSVTAIDPTVSRLLTAATGVMSGPTVVCNHAYKTFSVAVGGSGSAKVTLFGSADGTIFVPLAVFDMNAITLPTDGLATGATSHTKFYMRVSDITGSPILNATVMGVF